MSLNYWSVISGELFYFKLFIKQKKKKGYIGCFADSIPSDMIYLSYQYTSMTIEYCQSLCYDYNFRYAGLQAGYI